MKNRIISLFLLAIMALGILSLSACKKEQAIIEDEKVLYTQKDVGDSALSGYYGFYIHWQRDYYKQLLKNYGYDLASKIDQPYSNNKTVRETIVDTAKTQYLTFLVITQKFEEMNLKLPDETIKAIEKQYTEEWVAVYGESGMKNILSTLSLSKEQFLKLLSVQSKSNMILDYYYGEKGQTPITEQDKKDYFKENYQRFKYILLTTADENNKKLPAAELQKKIELSETLLQQLKDGTITMEEAIPEHSENYTKITDRMTEDEKTSAESTNKEMVTDGLITDKNGIFNQTLYTLYNMSLDSSILEELSDLTVGEISRIELDNAIWIVKKYDLEEDASYFEKREQTIYQALYGDDFNAKYTRWIADLDYYFYDDVLAKLDPGTFSDLFSEVYNQNVNQSASTAK